MKNNSNSLLHSPIPASILASLLVLSGCASGPENVVSLSRETAQPQTTLTAEEPADLPVKPFATESLYDLLVADVALTRNQFDIALPKYLRQARETRDSGVIEMAGRVANYMGDHKSTLEMAHLWLENEPQNPDAREAVMQAYAKLDDAIGALEHASWLYQHQDDSEAFLAVTSIPTKRAQVFELLNAYSQVELSKDKQPTLLLATGILFRDSDQLAKSEQAARQFLATEPDDQRGLLLLAQVMHQQDRIEEATLLIADALERQPQNRKLRLQYARFLTITDRSLAVTQFEILHLKDSGDQEVNFLLALLLLNEGNVQRANLLFTQASSSPSLRADAQYHLGSIAEKSGQPAVAIQHYSQVRFGRNYLAAAARLTVLLAQYNNVDTARRYLQRLRSEQPEQAVALFQIESNLLISAKQPDKALLILTDGLDAFPNDSQLLYARSMVAEQQDNFALAEQDLRALIAQDINNAVALNALGYTMILHTDRWEEAYTLIKRAYLLNPGDPATIDSMGWVLFQMGKLDEALSYLEKAHDILPDPEIAAHLGEVYWAMGNQELALDIWQLGLQQVPDHPAIIQTMQRLGTSIDQSADNGALGSSGEESSAQEKSAAETSTAKSTKE
ncbi:MAG: tetratricopeptide repeat protein [Porticoccaceae bacterium]|nr:tetratricopeptide repeat protein [Porticoccaceae bacterium]MDG1312480.1 tetratricopeptide repeat protein [Porticoccaceae bacterium]